MLFISYVQEADIDEMFDFADADSDGRLSFREFEVVVDVNVMHIYNSL